MKILHAPMQICGLMTTFSDALNKTGYSAHSISFLPHYFKQADRELNINQYTRDEKVRIRQDLFDEVKDIYDVFHFHFGYTLLYDQADLPYLYQKGKKLIMHHNGSDVRLPSIGIKTNPYIYEMYGQERSEKEIIKYICNSAEWIETAIIQDVELLQYVEPYYSKVEILPLPIDLSLEIYSPHNDNINDMKTEKKFRILHAPTNKRIKGTKYVFQAIDSLRQNGYDVELKLVEGLNHDELMKEVREADIIIDQLLLGTYGLFSIECMALGKPVICYISEYVKSSMPDELPIISANKENLTHILRNLLENRDSLEGISKQSRLYVEKYHDLYNVILPKLLDIYKS